MSDLARAAFDHTASLQQQVDQLCLQLDALAFAILGLALVALLLSWRLWHD